MGKVCVVGSLMMDLVVRAPRRPRPGETVIGTDFQRFLGGKGFNQAIAAARAGAVTTLVGRVGDDEFGREFMDRLQLDGVHHECVYVDEHLGTGIGAPLVEESGENSIVIVPRANSALTADDVERAAAAIESADVLLLQLELPIETALTACAIARAASTRVILNPAPAQGAHDQLRGLVDVLVPNEGEAATLLGGGGGRAELAELVAIWGCAVVMTAASAGCVVATGNGEPPTTAPPFVVQAIDTVGAGDAFCGTLAAWLADGLSIHEAVRYANAAGAIAVTRRGAEPAMPRRGEVIALVEGGELVDSPRR